MNKIDQLIKNQLLLYPTLFSNRFEVLSFMLDSSNYEWENGELIQRIPDKKGSREEMLKRFEDDVVKEENPEFPDLISLNARHLVSAKQRLVHATFIADNIDVFATTYAGVKYPVIQAWLWHLHRHGINDYYPIKNIPENVTIEWKKVIYDWLHEIIPTMNGLWGMYSPDGWKALPEYEKNFN